MRNLLLITLCFIVFANKIHAQVPKVMPPEAEDFYNKSMPVLRLQVKTLVIQNAAKLKHNKINPDSLTKVLSKNSSLKGMNSNDIAGITVLIMVQASKDADEDLKKMVMEISRKSDQNNSIAKENEDENSKLQSILDRKSGIAEEVGYVMKKITGGQQGIINNLR